ncbi:hypothetical protein PDE_03521 [Penicillium oxalicum 114-2]|uniref:F-box domain-containing protein n=1 Tax=Penicillium oxalicum (strain 114-2 / CGMCC 5302) TaxID=933388 RepID=S7ZD52_PENO1|nr:hypothetical protein PDE_03521 [Penicillium oxalicum 114-2]
MAAPRTLPFVKSRKYSERQGTKKRTIKPPPPLKLEADQIRAQVFKDLSQRGALPKAVRGRLTASPKPTNRPHKDKRLSEIQEVPIKMEVPIAQAEQKTVEIAEQCPMDDHPVPSEQIKTTDTPSRRPNSLRTILVLDSPGSSEADGPDISPLSETFPIARSKSGKVLRRFFPELSNNFGLVSPMSSDVSISQPGSQLAEYCPLAFESELEDRVQTLYKDSMDADDGSSSQDDSSSGHRTESSLASEEPCDDVSSCYSRRTSITSVESDISLSVRRFDAYSILSPSALGVFDDYASPVKSCRTSANARFSNLGPGATSLVRRASTGSGLSLYDVKNKPLPLEPVEEPSPLEVRRPARPIRPATRPSSPALIALHHDRHASFAPLDHKHSQSEDQQWGRRDEARDKRSTASHVNQSSLKEETTDRPSTRPSLTMDRAAEELEDALADLADLTQSPPPQQQKFLVLEGPLQISRHQGDLIATRPAPLPPTTRPHSQAPSSNPFKKSKSLHFKTTKPVDTTTQSSTSMLRPFRSAKERRSRREAENKHAAPQELAGAKEATPALSGTSSVAELPSSAREEPSKSSKTRKSFSMKIASFRRSNQLPARAPVDAGADACPCPRSRLSVIYASRSESSLVDPLNPAESEAHADALSRPPRLSSRPDFHERHGDEAKKKEGAETTVSKGEDLRLQLPRLQTHDLTIQLNLESRSSDKESLCQSPSQQHPHQSSSPSSCAPPPHRGQQPRPPPERSEKTRSPTMTSFCAPGPTLSVHPCHRMPVQNLSSRRRPELPAVNLHLVPPEDEKILVASEIVASEKASSVQLPPEQIFELAATPPSPTSSIPSVFPQRPPCVSVHFPGEMPDHLVTLIMERIDSLDDLFNFVLVNRRFYEIFKRRELFFLKTALFRMSPPAWEMREMSPPWSNEWQLLVNPDTPVVEYTPNSYLDRYANDIYTLAQLKSMILVRCAPFLRRETIKGLSGVDMTRAEEVDDAFWRIWTFCRIFGNGKGRENDLEGQMDWLKGGTKARNSFRPSSTVTGPFGLDGVLFEPPEGFARGNGVSGLSAQQLYDITEIWTCLGVLLQPLHGQCAEARKAGVFDGMDIAEGDVSQEETALEEWTSFILTLGLSAVLTLSSLCPAEASSVTFTRAQSHGLTKWEPASNGISRSCFLKEAVSRIYDEQERMKTSTGLQAGAKAQPESLHRRRLFQEELRTGRLRGHARHESDPVRTFADERPMSEFSTILHKLDGTEPRRSPLELAVPAIPLSHAASLDYLYAPPSVSKPPFHNLGHARSRSLTPGSTMPSSRCPRLRTGFTPPAPRPYVQDPVDRALSRMVDDLGFNPEDVKWALKITDTGEGLDTNAAEKLLRQQKRKNERNPFATKGKDGLLKSMMKRKGSHDSGWRFA